MSTSCTSWCGINPRHWLIAGWAGRLEAGEEVVMLDEQDAAAAAMSWGESIIVLTPQWFKLWFFANSKTPDAGPGKQL
jgi:hypothetical protein